MLSNLYPIKYHAIPISNSYINHTIIMQTF